MSFRLPRGIVTLHGQPNLVPSVSMIQAVNNLIEVDQSLVGAIVHQQCLIIHPWLLFKYLPVHYSFYQLSHFADRID